MKHMNGKVLVKIDYAQQVHVLSFYFSAELLLQMNKLFLLL